MGFEHESLLSGTTILKYVLTLIQNSVCSFSTKRIDELLNTVLTTCMGYFTKVSKTMLRRARTWANYWRWRISRLYGRTKNFLASRILNWQKFWTSMIYLILNCLP